jgi:hypothetical protein
VETIGAPKDRYGDRHLVVGRRRQPKKRTQGDCGLRYKLVAPRRRLIRRAVLALRKGRCRKGPGKTPANGIRGRSRRQELRVGSKRAFNKTISHTLGLEVPKRAVEFSVGLRKMSDGTLWVARPPPKRKEQ